MLGSLKASMSVFTKILRTGEGKKNKALEALVPLVNSLEDEIRALPDEELQAKTPEFRQRLEQGEDLDDLLIEAFAVVREASRRVIGQRHYDVQLMGGAALHFGWVAEMKTGEGKTLVSTLPVYLNGLTSKGVHVVTVNDYLASRDSEWMGAIHEWLGLTVGLVIPSERDPNHKQAQYACDITYGTNNELGFDYLRDNMVLGQSQKVQRGHTYCIVDEVDSILVDEARTPLIISGRLADAAQTYYKFASIVRGLHRDTDYEVDEEKRLVVPTEDGIHSVEAALGVENLYDWSQVNYIHQLNAALRAKELYQRDKDYVVLKGEVKIVDEFTGRILEGRRWSDGLHQAVEAKEGVRINEENQTLATVTLQNYFRLYDKLAGMTGTAQTEAAELHGTYGLEVVSIPTNEEVVRADRPDVIYRTDDAKFDAVVEDIAQRHEAGQPVLIGTISVEKSEKLAGLLNRRGIKHEVLNAKQHFREAEIIAQAGKLGSVTVATNMAGRGVDIILGGNPENMAHREVVAQGLDPEAEQGQALYDDLLEKFKPICEAEGVEVCDKGGLYVLGTERHESRRIDNQLRGRSGRQGDPGESRFYLSLEDDLLRIFATGAMNWVMSRSMPDDIPIESKMVTKAVERAQATVEQKNAETRKNVLKYDEVMNQQRKVIYSRRDQILAGADMRAEAEEYITEAVDAELETYCADTDLALWDIEGLHTEVKSLWPTQLAMDDLLDSAGQQNLPELLLEDAKEVVAERASEIGEEMFAAVEREVMLRIIDQRWREHLYEMDYLKEGIHLRAMGQKDPLTEWQREGFDMFGQMLKETARDYVRTIMHVSLAPAPPEPFSAKTAGRRGAGGTGGGRGREIGNVAGAGVSSNGVTVGNGRVGDADYSESADQPVGELVSVGAANAAPRQAPARPPQANTANAPRIIEEAAGTYRKSDWDRTPRNAPCPCGSGKKFKQCHGN